MKVQVTNEQAAEILDYYKSGMELDPETGELRFGELPIQFSRAEVMSNIYLELEKLVGESASGVMKRLGRSYGGKFLRLIREERPQLLVDREALYRFICAETQAIGWGRITIQDDGDTITISSKHGFASGRTVAPDRVGQGPVDSFFLGYFQGLLEDLDHVKYESRETECVARGDRQCMMVFKRKA